MQNVLFLCTANSARSIMAEALLRHWGDGVFTAFSAGSRPAGSVSPMAWAELESRGIDSTGLRSKSWEEFRTADAPVMDLVITVCDSADVDCPDFPGSPIRLHWGLPDPATALGGEAAVRDAFAAVADRLEQRIARLVTIPFADRDPVSVQSDLEAIAAVL